MLNIVLLEIKLPSEQNHCVELYSCLLKMLKKIKTVIFTFKETDANNNYNKMKIIANLHPKIRIKWFKGTKMTIICTSIPKFLFQYWGNSRMASN